MDELVAYLKENLNVYTKDGGRIEFLSLAHDISIFNARKLQQVRESLSLSRTNSLRRDAASSVERSSMERSLDNSHRGLRDVPKLSDVITEFKIERHGIEY